MNWIILIVAGFFESGFAFCLGKMKEVSGTEWYLWGAGFLVCLGLSMLLLAKAVQTLPIGTAYPVWTESGIGIMLQEIAENDFSHKRFMQRNGGTIFVLFSDFPYLCN